MEKQAKTKQDLRSEATRERLIAAARTLFGERGYAGVGTEEIVQAAGLTRGALYHQFRDKADLFAAVVEVVEAEVTSRISRAAAVEAGGDPLELLRAGARKFLEVCAEPEVERIVLLDAPSVMGWEAWRDLGKRGGLGLVQNALEAAMEAGRITRQPVGPLAHVLVGAVDECALYVARSEDQEAAREECIEVLDRLLAAL
jgi:AcrR family transcriptional regulator